MKTVIVDIDGVCYDPTARLERCKDADGNIDWDRAFSDDEVIQDPPIKGAVDATIEIVDSGYDIVFMTGRNRSCKKGTIWMLEKERFAPYFDIYMRGVNDRRPDYIIKSEIIKAHKIIYFDKELIAAVDDDWSGNLRDMYLGWGIPHYYTFSELFQDEKFGFCYTKQEVGKDEANTEKGTQVCKPI